MKKEEKALVMSAIEFLNIAANYKGEDMLLGINNAKEELTKLIYMGMRKTNKKIDIFSFCTKDNLRPAMSGVFYDTENKVAVASDGHRLIVSKSDYIDYANSDYVHTEYGYIVNKKGKAIEGRYPNYNSVFPKLEECESYSVDCEKLRECIKQEKLRREVETDKPDRLIKIRKQYFSLDMAETISKFDDGVFYTRKDDTVSALTYRSNDENYRCLFMPRYAPDVPVGQDEHDYYVDYLAC